MRMGATSPPVSDMTANGGIAMFAVNALTSSVRKENAELVPP